MKKSDIGFILILLAVFAMFLSACGSPPASNPAAQSGSADLKGTIGVSGAFALYPMMTVWAEPKDVSAISEET